MVGRARTAYGPLVRAADFAPQDAGFIADPYPVFDELRAAGRPLWHDELQIWLACRHADADAVLRDRRLGRVFRPRTPTDTFARFNQLHVDSILDSEPPQHTRLRRLVAPSFARGRLERLRAGVRRTAEQLIAAARDRGGPIDLIADYAAPLPVAVIAQLLGVPDADRHLLRPWSNAMVKMYEYGPSEQLRAAAVRASAEFADYLERLVAERRAAPQGDLVSDLVAQLGDRLSVDELVANCVLLLNAGHEASVNTLGNGMLGLFRTPDQLDLLRANVAALLPTAIEELVRYDGPLQMFERTAYEDVEIAGVMVHEGQKIAALLGAADRDPEVFADPAAMRVDRDPNPHIGFGAGIHFCLGAPLARLELTESLPVLLSALPRMTLAEEPVYRPHFVIRGLQSLVVDPKG